MESGKGNIDARSDYKPELSRIIHVVYLWQRKDKCKSRICANNCTGRDSSCGVCTWPAAVWNRSNQCWMRSAECLSGKGEIRFLKYEILTEPENMTTTNRNTGTLHKNSKARRQFSKNNSACLTREDIVTLYTKSLCPKLCRPNVERAGPGEGFDTV